MVAQNKKVNYIELTWTFNIIIVFTKSDKSYWGKIYLVSLYNIWKDMKNITSNLTKSRKAPALIANIL